MNAPRFKKYYILIIINVSNVLYRMLKRVYLLDYKHAAMFAS